MKIAIVTGKHGFQEAEFDAVFEGMDGIEFVREDLSDFVKDPNQSQYKSVVFYNFHRPYPDPEAERTILSLADRGQGLVILHHAILAYPEWEIFSDICGIDDRSFGYHMGQRIHVQVADKNHPITAGLDDWEMPDETYTMKDTDEGSHILLTVNHPKSMKVIGWTREYRNSHVFCFQSGHDNDTYSHPQFREVLSRGIRWSARCL
ncbi:ThuA domain-containing protein [Candidatus Poribacteria bacterium]|nr:ThuA domain-containing protein [Candidatus Poribacteria bacterium]